MNELTQAELATNAATWTHIDQVMRLLAAAQVELMRRQFTHDRSKLSPPEVSMFCARTATLEGLTYGSDAYEAQRQAMLGEALNHHYQHNRHHPEHFEAGINDMNLFDLLEMICDWYAATKRHQDGNIYKSLQINQERFGMSDQLTQILLNTVPWLDSFASQYQTQADLMPIDSTL